jgi:hypothetical protein
VSAPAACDVTVEMAFGVRPGTPPDPGDWVDVTDWVDVPEQAPFATASAGSTHARQAADPGRFTISLVNNDRRFDPRNTEGPYHGNLVPGVPVRITTTYDSVTETRWSGYVKAWPQQITQRLPVVELSARDLHGQLSAADGPSSAWDASIPRLSTPPEQWWRPGVDGWIDQIGRRKARNTSQLREVDTLIAGGDKSWGQVDPDGCGVTEDASLLVDPDTGRIVISMWIRIDERDIDSTNTYIPLFSQGDAVNPAWISLRVYAWWHGINVSAFSAGFDLSHGTMEPRTYADHGGAHQFDERWWIADGKPHHVLIVVDEPATAGWSRTPAMEPLLNLGTRPLSTGPQPHIWIDGIEPPAYGIINKPGTGNGPGGAVKLGGMNFGAPGYSGAVDHLLVWGDHPGSDTDLAALAAELNELGRSAWAGQRLDERFAKIVTSAGYGDHLGTLDTSSIVTRQGYRRRGLRELLQAIENTEQGRIWVDREGTIRYSARPWAWTDSRSTTVQATFSDDPDELDGGAIEMLESGTVVTDGVDLLANAAQVTSEYGRMQTVEDPDSIALYDRQLIHLSGLLHPSDRQSLAIAQWLTRTWAEPVPRVKQLRFRVESDPEVCAPVAQTIDQGDLVRVVLATPTNPETGDPVGEGLDLLAHVIGVEHSWSALGWDVTLHLDSSRAGRTWFRADISTTDGPDVAAF